MTVGYKPDGAGGSIEVKVGGMVPVTLDWVDEILTAVTKLANERDDALAQLETLRKASTIK